jgi:hypothetical protein
VDTLNSITYQTKSKDLNSSSNSRLSDRLEKILKAQSEMIDELSKHGCKNCIAIVQRVIRDNRGSNRTGIGSAFDYKFRGINGK